MQGHSNRSRQMAGQLQRTINVRGRVAVSGDMAQMRIRIRGGGQE